MFSDINKILQLLSNFRQSHKMFSSSNRSVKEKRGKRERISCCKVSDFKKFQKERITENTIEQRKNTFNTYLRIWA